MGNNFRTRDIMRIIFLLFTSLIFSQATKITYTTPKQSTVPFYKNDKTEIQEVVNANSDILKELDDSIDLIHGSALRTIQKVVNANSTVNFFSIKNSNGVISLDAKVVSEGGSFYLIKHYDITFVKGQTGYFIKESTSNPIHDFDIILTDITESSNIVGYTLAVQNKSLTESTTITISLTIGGTLTPITYTQL